MSDSTQIPPPKIPHLLTLRKGARGSARGGRPTTDTDTNTTTTSNNKDKDKVIRNTDNDASSSRVSAVEAGYLVDPFAKVLGGGDGWMRRLPLMNRGTYVRTTAIDRIVDTFLSSNESVTPGRKQIISLGAGSDTRYFRLKRDKRHAGFIYHELDFLDNTRAKISRLKDPKCIDLVKQECGLDLSLAEDDVDAGELTTDEYSIHAIDLRALPASLPWLDSQASTLLISECCLIYLSPDAADKALGYFATQLAGSPLAIAIYEPFRPGDAFGQTMIRNLMTRGIVLQTMEKYADLDKQKGRLEGLGMKARVMDCEEIWRLWIDQEEKERIDRLEWMDEVEEFVLLARHYCVAWGWRGFGDDARWSALG